MKLYERFADKGYHSSVATTFGVDFDAYENIALPRLRGAGCRNNIVISDSAMLTHALGGASALPKHAGRLYTAAAAQAEGLFHPKLFLQIGRRGGQLLIGSANLTTAGLAGNLELVAQVTCSMEQSGEQSLIAQAWQYLSGLINPADPMLPKQRDWMLARAPWLRAAQPAEGTIELSDGTKACLLIGKGPTGIGSRFATLIREEVRRLIVVSPYWDPGLAALKYLTGRLQPTETAVLIDYEAGLFPGAAAAAMEGLAIYGRGDFECGRFIHAKALIAETEYADHVLIGSANCTQAALGTGTYSGSNDEVSLYRRFPPATAVDFLRIGDLLQPEQRVHLESLPPLAFDDEIPFEALVHLNPGTFSLRGDLLTWRPAGHLSDPAQCKIDLLGEAGNVLEAGIAGLQPSATGTLAGRVRSLEQTPAFAQVIGEHRFSPAIITNIDLLQAAIRETHSHKTETLLAQLGDETEATIDLLTVLDLLEAIENEQAGNAPVPEVAAAAPVALNEPANAADPAYLTLSYAEFTARPQTRQLSSNSLNSLGGSNVSIVRSLLNRIIGLESLVFAESDNDDDDLTNAFDLGDETGDMDAEPGLVSGGDQPSAADAAQKEERLAAARRSSTRSQLVEAAGRFAQRMEHKQREGGLTTQDFLRLRALLTIICSAAWKGADKSKGKQSGRSTLQVLPVEGHDDSWPFVIGRLLNRIFGGAPPPIRSLNLDADFDEIPVDLLECWATCFWCLQACRAASASSKEQRRIDTIFGPFTERVYRETHLSKDQLLGTSVLSLMDALTSRYAERLGVDAAALMRSHLAAAAKQDTQA